MRDYLFDALNSTLQLTYEALEAQPSKITKENEFYQGPCRCEHCCPSFDAAVYPDGAEIFSDEED